MEKLKYPIGRYTPPAKIVAKDINQWIRDIQTLPNELKKVVGKLNDEQLDTPYRPEGWTIRQVIHHLADSHANAFVRFKLALTEENPTIKPYQEALWAELHDGKFAPIAPSLMMLQALHKRWLIVLKNTDKKTLAKSTYLHPESGKVFNLAFVTGLYSWHGRHHLAQITNLLAEKGW
jgi:DinB superfamily